MTEQAPPAHARCVIVGGGIVGCSVAYHLVKLGWTDVVLLEQGRLSGGTTWHAAGLVGQLRSHEGMTRLVRASTELYAGLEAETGLATGWKRCGSLTVARSNDRMTQLKRTAATARAYGVEAELITAKEAGALWPPMRIDDLEGAVWLPGDGKANPTDLTQALARGARLGGARIFERTRVTGITVANGAAVGVETPAGAIACEAVVNCAGQWARQLGRLCGVAVPLHSAEHMYIVTRPIAGVAPDLPVMRDPDGYIYFKEEVGGLVMGGFEPDAKPWATEGVPDDFAFSLLPDDWDQFEILMDNALVRVPALETAEVRTFVNGPESFTPDNNFILGEAPELRNFFVAAGFNSMGIASAGGAGRALARWIVDGAPDMDLWPVDIRRFARFNANPTWLRDRIKETLGLHYAMPWPNRELETARPFRRSPLYDRLAAKGARFGSKMGWERANWFAPGHDPSTGTKPLTEYSFGRQNWFEAVGAEHRASRTGVAVFDQTSFSKFLLQGRDAARVLNRLCAGEVDVAVGRSVYTGMLNDRGGYESDLTVMRLAPDGNQGDRYLIVTGSAQTTRDAHWIRRNTPDDAHAVLTDVTSAYAVIGVMGPASRALLSRLTVADLGNRAFPFASHQTIDLGYATVTANRMTYVGELGWELFVPTEFAAGVYDDLISAGADLGVTDAGYYALESLRLEKGYRAWGRELTPDVNPYEAGLGFAVALDKPTGFIGQTALRSFKKTATLNRRILQFTLDDPDPVLWGGELILRDGRPVGALRSAAYGYTLGAATGLGWIRDDHPIDAEYIANATWQIDIAGTLTPATAHLRTPYDPKSERVRSDS
jgi:glycine cleavage system aminomethyltransferase T/glycine/D-amino acid oxidase-like deaminating enzyme